MRTINPLSFKDLTATLHAYMRLGDKTPLINIKQETMECVWNEKSINFSVCKHRRQRTRGNKADIIERLTLR